jgi:hypothetical protein
MSNELTTSTPEQLLKIAIELLDAFLSRAQSLYERDPEYGCRMCGANPRKEDPTYQTHGDDCGILRAGAFLIENGGSRSEYHDLLTLESSRQLSGLR